MGPVNTKLILFLNLGPRDVYQDGDRASVTFEIGSLLPTALRHWRSQEKGPGTHDEAFSRTVNRMQVCVVGICRSMCGI